MNFNNAFLNGGLIEDSFCEMKEFLACYFHQDFSIVYGPSDKDVVKGFVCEDNLRDIKRTIIEIENYIKIAKIKNIKDDEFDRFFDQCYNYNRLYNSHIEWLESLLEMMKFYLKSYVRLED